MKKHITLLLLLTIFIFIGCSSKETSETSQKEKEETTETPKGATSILGSIVSIDSTQFSGDKNSPCSKAPCWAEVKIEKALGVGQGGPSFSVGDTVSVNFKFTLSETTKELIPNLDKRMPGLMIMDKFEANIMLLSSTNTEKLYTVYFYEKR